MEIVELSRHRVVLKLPAFPTNATQAKLILMQPRMSKVPYKEWTWSFSYSSCQQNFEIPNKLIPGQRYFVELVYYKVTDLKDESDKIADHQKVRKLRMQFRAGTLYELYQIHLHVYNAQGNTNTM